MYSFKAALAASAVVATTVGGAYAADAVVNKNGHEVDAHAAFGQSVAAAARAQAAESATPSADPTEATETAEPTDAATTEAAEASAAAEMRHFGWTNGQHKGWAKKGKHLGVGHATGTPDADETEAPEAAESDETEAPETEAPETEAPETEAPETEAPAPAAAAAGERGQSAQHTHAGQSR